MIHANWNAWTLQWHTWWKMIESVSILGYEDWFTVLSISTALCKRAYGKRLGCFYLL